MKKSLLIIISILSLSCSDDNTNNLGNTDMNLVTGINLRQTAEDIPFEFGNPNILVNNKFVAYPNPVNDVVNIAAQENITDIWLVRGTPKKIYQNINFSSILNNNLYPETSIITNSDFALNGQSSEIISLNISTLEKGYYKVFVKIGGQIYWDNLYKYEEGATNEEQFNALFNFWD
ncbi:hypothetical protein [Flavobacterium sp. UBA7682]|uniref:hypothetical protein n=1 Tax=Flavobacterium sp. UBA7682 TaxID=1946560 RepID=UPI0025C06FE9|nr:hypothetical protein [Flavobacterium sp. UBA7682]